MAQKRSKTTRQATVVSKKRPASTDSSKKNMVAAEKRFGKQENKQKDLHIEHLCKRLKMAEMDISTHNERMAEGEQELAQMQEREHSLAEKIKSTEAALKDQTSKMEEAVCFATHAEARVECMKEHLAKLDNMTRAIAMWIAQSNKALLPVKLEIFDGPSAILDGHGSGVVDVAQDAYRLKQETLRIEAPAWLEDTTTQVSASQNGDIATPKNFVQRTFETLTGMGRACKLQTSPDSKQSLERSKRLLRAQASRLV